eukprot:1271196-Pyramimonas_sp.AAC.2
MGGVQVLYTPRCVRRMLPAWHRCSKGSKGRMFSRSGSTYNAILTPFLTKGNGNHRLFMKSQWKEGGGVVVAHIRFISDLNLCPYKDQGAVADTCHPESHT